MSKEIDKQRYDNGYYQYPYIFYQAEHPPMQLLTNKPLSIISTQYFIHFGVMGIFLPYFNLYCYHLDFSEFQIGMLSAVRVLIMVLFSLIWGGITDYFIKRKTAYIFCTAFSALLWSLLSFTTDYNSVLIIIILYSIFYGPIIAFLETYSIEILSKSYKGEREYGTIRAWGSVSFILVSMSIGPLIDLYSIELILSLILIASAIQACSSLQMPDSVIVKNRLEFSQVKLFFSRKTSLFLLSTFLMLVSHGAYYGFFSIHIENIGFSPVFTGCAWALASVSEILIMINSKKIFNKFSIRSVLLFSFIITCIRWVILFFSTSLIAILFSQTLHAFTYGSFHIACILYIDKLTVKETKTFGQIVFNSTSYGLGMMVGFIISGFFFEEYGAQMFLFSAITAFLGLVAMLIQQNSRAIS